MPPLRRRHQARGAGATAWLDHGVWSLPNPGHMWLDLQPGDPAALIPQLCASGDYQCSGEPASTRTRCHCDLFVDDSSFDMESKSVGDVVHKSMEIWRHVKRAFRAQQLPISIEKSAWVCSSRAVEKKLAAQLGPEDPKIRSCWRDLGVDSAGGKTRRVTIHRQRFVKAAARSKKLSQLKTSGRVRTRAAKAGSKRRLLMDTRPLGLLPRGWPS